MPPLTASLEVTLHALGHCDEFVKRVILLSPGSKIHIGRSSRSSKTSPPAANNASFDCPVMSREHAVLVSSTTRGLPSVSVRDCGSMHGTRVNNVLVESSEGVPLRNGDILQIGADIYRDKDSFRAPRFRFEARPAPNAGSQVVSSAVFAVPDTETSEDEDDSSDDDEPTVMKTDHIARYGTQSNPVNVDDFEDSQSHAGVSAAEDKIRFTAVDNKVFPSQVDSEETHKNRTERQYSPLSDDGYLDLNDDDLSDEDASHGSAPSPTYSPASPIYSEEEYESNDEDAEDEPLFPDEPLQETVSRPAKFKTVSLPEPVTLANSSDLSDHDFSDDGYGYCDDEGSSPASSPVDFDAHRRSKLTEMLNQDREKAFVKATVWTHPPDVVFENHTESQMSTTAEVQAPQTLPPVPARASETPMSLKNIMVNERDVAPSSHDAVKVSTSQATEHARRLSKSPEPAVSKAPPKDPSMKPVDVDGGNMVEFYNDAAWIAGAVHPRPTAPKPMPWIAGVSEYAANFVIKENEPWVDGCRSHPLSTYQDVDYRHQEAWYGGPYGRAMGNGAMNHVGRSGNFPDYVTDFTSNAPADTPFPPSIPPPCNIFDQASTQPKSVSGNRTGGPPVMMPTPPAASPGSRNTDQPSHEQHEPTKPRTGVSIPEILELTPGPTVAATTVGNLKRKVDVLDVEQPSEVTNSSNVKTEHAVMPREAVAPEQHPKKRLRLQFAATAVAGAMVGGFGVLGALISLPDSWLQ